MTPTPNIELNLFNESKIILDLCGGSGSWSKPYLDSGYDVRLITLPDNDVQLFVPPPKVYGVLAAPPCTHFAGSGARWWAEKGDAAIKEGLAVVTACLRIIWLCSPVFWVLENPVGRLNKYIGKPKIYFNPCDYGDPYTKKTALWGNFNIPKPCPVEPTEGSKMHKLPPSEDRWALRSITPPGFARAFFEANR